MRPRLVSVSFSLVLAASPALAQDWPCWRGPSYDGSSPATGLVRTFDADTGVRWEAALPGPGASTPIVVGERVFLTSLDGETLVALCFDRRTGALAWKCALGSGYRAGEQGSTTVLHDRSNYASPSPVADAERVVFFFGNGDLVATDHAGEELWRRNLQKDHGDFAFQWTFSASPTLEGGRLYVQVLQRDEPVNGVGGDAPSFLLALDPKSGEQLFRHVRPAKARKESLESYATPIPYVAPSGERSLLVVGGDVLTAHDMQTGAELWRWGTWNEGHREEWWRIVPSPVVGAGHVLVCAPKRAPVYAIRLATAGVEGAEPLAWKSEGRANPVSSDVPTPLFYQGRFYVLSDVREALSCVAPDTGEVAWTIALPREHLWRASPTGADGRVWLVDHGGRVLVVDAKDGKTLHSAALGDEDEDRVRSSIAVAHGDVYVRTSTKLLCFGAGPEPESAPAGGR